MQTLFLLEYQAMNDGTALSRARAKFGEDTSKSYGTGMRWWKNDGLHR